MSQDSTPLSGPEPPPHQATPFALPSRLVAAQATALAEQLAPAIDQDDLTLDAGAVESVGTAGLQVLAALVKSRAGRPTRWRAVSPTLLGAARLSGLTDALALPAENLVQNASENLK